MVRVSVEVRSGAGCFRAAVWAESVERAVRLAGARYPGWEARVLFPIDPEVFFVEGPVSAARKVLPEVPEEAVG